MSEIYLNQIAHGRSGDKGDTSNVCVFAREPQYYEIIKREVTVEAVHKYFGDMVQGEIARYELPSLNGFNFVMRHALGGGATHSLRLDSLGKSMGSAFMRMRISCELPLANKHMALEDITVLDLTKVLAGPYCGSILADFGAKVIKIEPPKKGDDSRAYAPHINGESLYYANLNRGKQGMTLNLKSEEGKEILKKLVAKADVLIENYRPGVMKRLGLDYDVLKEINPRLIYGAITGFGAYGPYSDRPGYDIISQAMGGLMSVTGQENDPPTRCGNAMGDVLGGMNMAIGILTALHARSITGMGQYIDVALVDSVVASLEQAWQRYFTTGKVPVRHGNSYDAIAPYDSFKAKDGYLVIGCGNQKLFEVLCKKLLQRPELIEDERFLDVPLRVKNNKAFKVYVEEWLQAYTVEEAVAMILESGIPVAPLLDMAQIANDEHIAGARKIFVEVEDPIMGKVKLNNTPIKLSDTAAEIRSSSPTLGQHTETILSRLGYTPAQIEDFRRNDVF